MTAFFTAVGYTVFYQPLYNIIIAICTLLPVPPSLGLAIILLALGVTFLLLPLSVMRHLSDHHRHDLAHAIAEIREKYADHPERGRKLTKHLLQENTSAIISSIVTLVIQSIIGLTLYTVLRDGFGPDGLKAIYDFLTPPDMVSVVWFGIDLRTTHHLLALAAALAVFLQMTIGVLTNPAPSGQDKLMQYVAPIGAYLILSRVSAGMSLFFLTLSGFGLSMTLLRESIALVSRQFTGTASAEVEAPEARETEKAESTK